MFGIGRPARYEADSGHDQHDADPALETDLLLQQGARQKGHYDVAKGGGRQHVGQIGPGERRQVSGKKDEKKADTQQNPGVHKAQGKARLHGWRWISPACFMP